MSRTVFGNRHTLFRFRWTVSHSFFLLYFSTESSHLRQPWHPRALWQQGGHQMCDLTSGWAPTLRCLVSSWFLQINKLHLHLYDKIKIYENCKFRHALKGFLCYRYHNSKLAETSSRRFPTFEMVSDNMSIATYRDAAAIGFEFGRYAFFHKDARTKLTHFIQI